MGTTGGMLLGQTRLKANQFVEGVQKPFEKRVANIFDPTTEARKAGTLTFEQAQDALDRFNAEVAAFETQASTFEGLGQDQKTVVGKARNTVNPLIAQWRTDLMAHIEALKPAEGTADGSTVDETKPPSMDTILTRGETAAGRAEFSSRQQAKKTKRASGFRGTILTGPKGLGTVPQTTRIKTILGY